MTDLFPCCCSLSFRRSAIPTGGQFTLVRVGERGGQFNRQDCVLNVKPDRPSCYQARPQSGFFHIALWVSRNVEVIELYTMGCRIQILKSLRVSDSSGVSCDPEQLQCADDWPAKQIHRNMNAQAQPGEKEVEKGMPLYGEQPALVGQASGPMLCLKSLPINRQSGRVLWPCWCFLTLSMVGFCFRLGLTTSVPALAERLTSANPILPGRFSGTSVCYQEQLQQSFQEPLRGTIRLR